MRFCRTLFTLLICLSGCGLLESTEPDSVDPVGTVRDTAREGSAAYQLSLADEARETAKRAHQYKSWGEAFDDWSARNKAARERSFSPYDDALNMRLLGKKGGKWNLDAPYDAQKLQDAASDAAEGYGAR